LRRARTAFSDANQDGGSTWATAGRGADRIRPLLALAHRSLAIALQPPGRRGADRHAQIALAVAPDPASRLAEEDRLLLALLREFRIEGDPVAKITWPSRWCTGSHEAEHHLTTALALYPATHACPAEQAGELLASLAARTTRFN
jgi:hypothetical protein